MPEAKATKWYSEFLAKGFFPKQEKPPRAPVKPPVEPPPGELPLEPGIHTVGTTQYEVKVNKDGSRSIRVLRKLSPRPVPIAEPDSNKPGNAIGQMFSGLGTMAQGLAQTATPQPGERAPYPLEAPVEAVKGFLDPIRQRYLGSTFAPPETSAGRLGRMAGAFVPPFTEFVRPRETPMPPGEFAANLAMFLPMAPGGALRAGGAPLGTLAEAGAQRVGAGAKALGKTPLVAEEAGFAKIPMSGAEKAGLTRLVKKAETDLANYEAAIAKGSGFQGGEEHLKLQRNVIYQKARREGLSGDEALARTDAAVPLQRAAKPLPGQAPLAEAAQPAAKVAEGTGEKAGFAEAGRQPPRVTPTTSVTPLPQGGTEGVVPPTAKAAQPQAAGVPPVGRGTGGKGKVPPSEDPVDKLLRLIKTAKPPRAETEVLKSKELGRRVAIAAKLYGKEEGFAKLKATGALKGELPQAEFVLTEKLTPADIKTLAQKIDASLPDFFGRLNTLVALEKITLGQLPTRGDLAALQRVFGKDLASALNRLRPKGTRFWEELTGILNAPRSIISSFDLSAPLRQGGYLATGRAKTWGRAWEPMVKAFKDPKVAQQVDDAIRSHPQYALAQDSGLFLAPIEDFAVTNALEEAFMSRLAARIPGVGASQRAYTTFLNKLRFDTFVSSVSDLAKSKGVTAQTYKDLTGYINAATGRGSLGKLDRIGDVLAVGFFSPRLLASRFQLPYFTMKVLLTQPALRKAVAKDLVSAVGVRVGLLSLAAAAGASVVIDPRSSDFGKLRIGNTRYDLWAGAQPIARYLSQIISGERKPLTGAGTEEVNRLSTAARFVRSKLSPGFSAIVDLLDGYTFMGEEMEATPEVARREALNRLAPLFLQDMIDAAQEYGSIEAGLLALPSATGLGVQTFKPETPQERRMRQLQERLENPGLRMQQRQENLRKRLEAVPAGAR